MRSQLIEMKSELASRAGSPVISMPVSADEDMIDLDDVVAEDLHAKGTRTPGNRLADIAHPDHAERAFT